MLESLGIWSRVALASRSAERVLPLYALTLKFDSASQEEVSSAVAFSREMATLGPAVVKTVVDARAAAAARLSREADNQATATACEAREALDASAHAARAALLHDAAARRSEDNASWIDRNARAFNRSGRTSGEAEAGPTEDSLRARRASRRAARAASSMSAAAGAADAHADRVQAHAEEAMAIASRAAEAARLASLHAAEAARAARVATVENHGEPNEERVTAVAAAAIAAANEAALSAVWAVAAAISTPGFGTPERATPGATMDAAVWDADWLRARVAADSLVPPEFFERPLWPGGRQSRCADWQEVFDTCRSLVARGRAQTDGSDS